jgi:hypothetical protein
MLSSVYVEALQRSNPPFKGSYRLCKGLRNREAPKAKQRAAEPLIIISILILGLKFFHQRNLYIVSPIHFITIHYMFRLSGSHHQV